MAQRGYLKCPRSHSWQMMEFGFKLSASLCHSLVLGTWKVTSTLMIRILIYKTGMVIILILSPLYGWKVVIHVNGPWDEVMGNVSWGLGQHLPSFYEVETRYSTPQGGQREHKLNLVLGTQGKWDPKRKRMRPWEIEWFVVPNVIEWICKCLGDSVSPSVNRGCLGWSVDQTTWCHRKHPAHYPELKHSTESFHFTIISARLSLWQSSPSVILTHLQIPSSKSLSSLIY